MAIAKRTIKSEIQRIGDWGLEIIDGRATLYCKNTDHVYDIDYQDALDLIKLVENNIEKLEERK